MPRTQQSFYSIGASLLCLLLSAAPTDQFTITVPVRLVNLPMESQSVNISCLLLTRADGRVGSAATGYVGMIYGFAPISGGAFNGEVVAAGNVPSGADPNTVTHYSCSLGVSARVGGRDITWQYGPTSRGPYLPVAAGAPLVTTVIGSIR